MSIVLPQRAASVARRELLDRPCVAVRILKEDKSAPGKILDIADLDALGGQMPVRLIDVGHNQLQTPYGSRGAVDDAFAHGNRTGRTGRRQLHETYLVAYRVIMIEVKADLPNIKGDGIVDARYGDRDQFQLPIHDNPFAAFAKWCRTPWATSRHLPNAIVGAGRSIGQEISGKSRVRAT
ncbi:hypothetical protein NKH10_06260 [Mesorhizobium sp. M1340]